MMEDNKYEVLVVDDTPGAARDYASLIKSKTGLPVAWAENAQQAIDSAAQNELKVIVLDQRMPMPGTELKEELMKSCPRAKFMMLTGEASKAEIGTAVNLGYDRYLDKANITDLSGTVLSLYAKYEEEQVERINTAKPIKRTFEFRGCLPYIVYVYDKLLINDHHVDEQQKQVIYRILAGEQKEFKHTSILSEELVIGTKLESSTGFQLKDPANTIGIIEASLKKVFTFKSKISVQETLERTITYSLQGANSDSILQRVIEARPIYDVYKVSMGYKSLFCRKVKRVVVMVRVFTSQYALRQTDFYNNKTIQETELGTY